MGRYVHFAVIELMCCEMSGIIELSKWYADLTGTHNNADCLNSLGNHWIKIRQLGECAALAVSF